MFLTAEEIAELTKRTRPSAQVKVLRALGIEHRQRPDRSIIVLRAHVEHLLGGVAPAKVRKPAELNLDTINA